jgi:predicted DNA-binding protein YlxM (UPF0122 family)
MRMTEVFWRQQQPIKKNIKKIVQILLDYEELCVIYEVNLFFMQWNCKR